jgi:hypothetical protein
MDSRFVLTGMTHVPIAGCLPMRRVIPSDHRCNLSFREIAMGKSRPVNSLWRMTDDDRARTYN